MTDYQQLRRNAGKDASALPTKKLAVLADSATQFLTVALKGHAFERGVNLSVLEGDYNIFDAELLERESELYSFEPDFILLYVSTEQLWQRFCETEMSNREGFAEGIVNRFEIWWKAIANFGGAKVIQFNFYPVVDPAFGHFSSRVASSFSFQVAKLNYLLLEAGQRHKHVFVGNLAGRVTESGLRQTHDPRLYVTAKVALSLEFLGTAAKSVIDIIVALAGGAKKCLIFDLDNTVWGGVIGDDGLENIQLGELGLGHAFDSLQLWMKELKKRGIILAVCSKNELEAAKLPFESHPDMTLRLEDLAVFRANWNNKADNIREIQRVLNISPDSMVFIDDNPFERNLVRQLLPEVTVPELPEDPALYVSYLQSLNLFETGSYSEEDSQRTKQYQEEDARASVQRSFTSIDDYLKDLEMVAHVRPFDAFSIPRVAQLTQRSNQFNLRTIRYSESDIQRMSERPDFMARSFSLGDRFGDYGLVGLAILERNGNGSAFIDTWIMSCRVLKRGMEELMINEMSKLARSSDISRLIGEYLPTAKNKMVRDIYSAMGFKKCGNRWELELNSTKEIETFIRVV